LLIPESEKKKKNNVEGELASQFIPGKWLMKEYVILK
jgi:hypothetical protein